MKWFAVAFLCLSATIWIVFFLQFCKRFKADSTRSKANAKKLKLRDNQKKIGLLGLAASGASAITGVIMLAFSGFTYVNPPKTPGIPPAPEIQVSKSGLSAQQPNAEEIWYTVDGSDPATSPSAFKYDGEAINVQIGQTVLMRAKNDAGWSDTEMLSSEDIEDYYLGVNDLDDNPISYKVFKQNRETRKSSVEKITLDPYKIMLSVDDELTIVATLSPERFKDAQLSWVSSKPEVAAVSSDGVVIALSPGETQVRVSYSDDIYAVCIVKVEPSKTAAPEESQPAPSPPILTQIRDWLNPSDKNKADKEETGGRTTGSETPTVSDVTTTENPTVNPIINEKKVKLQSIALTESITVNIGETAALSSEYFPENASVKNAKWSSSDSKIVKVNEYGVIMGLKEGTATVTLKIGTIKASCAVTVNKVVIPLEAIKIRDLSVDSPFEVEVKATMRVYYDVTPANATVSDLQYEISDTSVATVDRYGNVLGKSVGTTTLTVSADGFSAACSITVTPAIFADKIILSEAELDILKGDSHVLTATIEPLEAAKKKITWSSNSPDVASVADGVITAHKEGNAVITASVGSTTAKCKVKVKSVPVESVLLSASDIEVSVGKTVPLGYEISPLNADVKSLRWKSSDEKVARVTDGVIVGIREGTATISLTADGFTDKCTVTVVPMVYESIGFADEVVYTEIDSSLRLVYATYPAGADSRTVTWTSSNTQVATVIDGIVQGESEGAVWITASIGDVRAYCRVNVTATPVREIYLSKSQVDLEVGETEEISYTIHPAKANNRKVVIKSDDENVVRVYNGKLYAMTVGSATVTISADGVQTYCTVDVHPVSPKLITLDTYTLELEPGEQDTIGFMLDPIRADRDIIGWKVSNGSILSVDNGVITALREGTATVTAYYANVSASCTVTVKRQFVEAEDVLLPDMSSSINVGSVWEINAVVTPSNATEKALEWSSDRPDVVYVDQNGRLEALAPGSATITARCGNAQQSFTLYVPEPVVLAESILLPEMSSSINVGDIWDLSPVVTPSNATDKTLYWESDRPDIVCVDQTGRLQALAPGSATITVQCGNIRQSFILYVPEPIVEPVIE